MQPWLVTMNLPMGRRAGHLGAVDPDQSVGGATTGSLASKDLVKMNHVWMVKPMLNPC
jgi:hypothetical protein